MPLVWRVNTIEPPILYPLSPHNGTSRQPPPFCAPKVAVVERFDFVWSLCVSRVCRKWSHLAGFTLNPMSFPSFPRKTSQRTPRSWQTTRPGTARKRSSLHAGIKVLSEFILNKGFLTLRRSQNRYSSFSLEMENLVLDIYFDHDHSHTQTLHWKLL